MRPRPKIASVAPRHTAGVRRWADRRGEIRGGFFTSGETRSPLNPHRRSDRRPRDSPPPEINRLTPRPDVTSLSQMIATKLHGKSGAKTPAKSLPKTQRTRPPSFPEAKASLDAHLASRGMRRTGEREAILDVVLGLGEHFTPEDVAKKLRGRGSRLSVVTVYRNLPVLCDAGILRRTCLSAGETKYELVWGHEHHDHLICCVCHDVVEFQYEAIEVLQEAVAARHGFALTSHHLELVGICPACQAEGGGQST